MIPIVEDILIETIQTQLKAFQTNINIIDSVFSQASSLTRERLKQYLATNEIKVLRGFPINPANLPAYCVILGGEQEQVAGIGNSLDENEFEFEFETVIETTNINKVDDFYFVRLSKKPILEIFELEYNGDLYPPNILEVVDYGKGLIKLNIPVDESVNTVNISYSYKTNGNFREGTMFQSQYRVETWTNNGDLTVSLYYLLKWILLNKRLEMAQKGLFVQSLGGLDFEPAPEYFPEFVYRRALTFECQTESFININHDYVNDIIVDND